MAANTSLVSIPYDGLEFECPACCERVQLIAQIEVKGLGVRSAGSEGFHKPIHSINVETNLKGIRIQHDCIGTVKR